MAEHKINDVTFESEFKLSNPDIDEFEISFQYIHTLSIDQSIYNPFVSGMVMFTDGFQVFENNYTCRGDGYDKFSVKIGPKDGEEKLEYDFYMIEEKNHYAFDDADLHLKEYTLYDSKSLPLMETVPYNTIFADKAGKVLEGIFEDLLPDFVGEFEETDSVYNITPSINWTYMDVVNDILKTHYCQEKETYVKCFLMFEDGKYNFKKISDIFAENKDNTVEMFVMGADAHNVGSPFSYDKNPAGSDTEILEFEANLAHFNVSTPQYDYMSIMNTQYWVINSYDRVLGSLNQGIIKLDDLKESWQELFVDVFKLKGGKPAPFIAESETSKKRIKTVSMPYEPSIAKKVLECQLNNILTFHNINCHFIKRGSPDRVTGKFFDVARPTDPQEEWLFDAKALGRYLFTDVSHIFSNDRYFTENRGIKTYVHPDIEPSEA